jgi:hypothetical protein
VAPWGLPARPIVLVLATAICVVYLYICVYLHKYRCAILEILAEYDAAPEGAKGALLRREGLYSSHIVEWRKARDAGALAGLAVPRGRKRRDPQAEKIARLEAEKRQLEQELAKARFVVDVQAKLRTPSRGRRHDRPGRRPTRRRIGVRDACVAVSASQAGYYRRHRVSPPPERPATCCLNKLPTSSTTPSSKQAGSA